MPMGLTPGAISAIDNGDIEMKPVVKVVDVKLVSAAQGRYCATVTDGSQTRQALLATQLNELVRNNELKNGSVVQLLEYTCADVQSRRYNAIMKNDAPAGIIPIRSLNPYQGRWAIKARITAKGDLRRYNNAKGDGKVFSFNLLDSDGGEIRVTCFNAQVDRFYDMIEVGKVYMVSKGTLKPAKRDFNHLSNEWEILLDKTSTVDLCTEEDMSIPNQKFNFVSISKIEETPSNSIIDLIGIVTAVKPSVAILRKNGMETQRRIVYLKDMSGRSVELTLWGEFCNREGQDLQVSVDSGAYSIVAVKAAKVSDFSGKSVGTISSTQLYQSRSTRSP